MEVWVLVLEFLALLGLTGCGSKEEEDVMELTFDDILGNNESWDESEIYEEAETNEVPQGERGTCEALVGCTSACSESETVRMTGSGNEMISDISQLNKNDITRETPFSGCRLSPDKKCTLDPSYIEGGAWQDYDENYDMGPGKNALDCDRSYMFCQYGHGIIYFKDAGQTFKDQVEEKAEDELLITLDILQGMVIMAKDEKTGNTFPRKWQIKEVEKYDIKSFKPEYKKVRELTQDDIDEINRVLYKYEINTPNRVAHFLAQCTVESDFGTGPIERYTTDINQDFKKYEPGGTNAAGLGNRPGEGAKFRGAGAIHITGRTAYEGFQEYMKEQGIEDNKIVDDGAVYVGQKYFWEAAGYYWSVYKPQSANDDSYNLNKMCDEGKGVEQITDIVGGSNVELREKAYDYLIQNLNNEK